MALVDEMIALSEENIVKETEELIKQIKEDMITNASYRKIMFYTNKYSDYVVKKTIEHFKKEKFTIEETVEHTIGRVTIKW